MSNAFAISCWIPDYFILQQTLALVESIRKHDHKEDVIILTTESVAKTKLDRALRKYDNVYVEVKDLLRKDTESEWIVDRIDVSKLHYWSLTGYDNILGIDSDCLIDKPYEGEWNKQGGFDCFRGAQWSPLCAASMMLKPDEKTFHEMKDFIFNSSFDKETGWNNCGGPYIDGWDSWNFQSADSLQGFLVYYFHILKGILQKDTKDIVHHVKHAGYEKRSDWYLKSLRSLIGAKMSI